jgi:hypothetical protein
MNETRRWSVAEAEGARCFGLTTWASLRPFSALATGKCPISTRSSLKRSNLAVLFVTNVTPSARMRRDVESVGDDHRPTLLQVSTDVGVVKPRPSPTASTDGGKAGKGRYPERARGETSTP